VSKPHTHMTYTLSPNAQRAISQLPELSDYVLNDYLDWVCMRRESCRTEAERESACPNDRLMSFMMMMDYERVYTHAIMETERRNHIECPTCGDEGHVEDIDSPYDTIRECPTCS